MEENKSHFVLWCMLCAPLILGCDIRKYTSGDLQQLLTNKNLIDINQDPLLLQAKRIRQDNGIDILTKPLHNGDMAICFFNNSDFAQESNIQLQEVAKLDDRLFLTGLQEYQALDLLENTRCSFNFDITIPKLKPKEIKIYRIMNEH